MKLNMYRLPKSLNRIAVSAAALLTLAAVSSVAADYPATVSSYHPVGYWRLNGTNAVPVGDIATNSGSLGAQAQGAYIDGVVHPVTGIPGAGGDSAMNLTNLNVPSGGLSKLRIPWVSQLSSNAPFSVEFWARPFYTGAPACPASQVDFVLSPRIGWLFYQMNIAGNDGNGWYFRIYRTDGAVVTAATDVALDTTAWYHLVGVFDGTSIYLYVNGALAATTAVGGTYAPCTSQGIPLNFGGRGDGRSGNYGFGGDMDEGAYYGKALSPARVQAHYEAGINPGSTYNSVVLADAPLGYWRMDEPAYTPPDPSTLPLAVNSGTVAAAGDGTMYPGVTAAVAGPPCNGMGANNYACSFDGGRGFIDCGSSTGFEIPGNVTVAAWVKIKGWSHMFEGVVSKGWNGYRLNKYFTQSYFVNNQMDFSTPTDCTGSRVVADGLWHHVVGVYDGAHQNLYIDGTLDASIAYSGGVGVSTDPLCIGDIGNYWVASGSGSYMKPLFDGVIDEVAVLTNALTASQVLDLFNSAQEPPVITQQPQPPTGNVYEGMSVSFSSAAIGGLPLNYQWTKNGGTLSGQTATSLTLSGLTTGSSGDYAVVIANAYGSATSSIVALTVQTSPPLVFQQPQSMTRYASGTATFSVFAGGSTPLSYQWTNSGGVISGATNASYTIANIKSTDAGTYGVLITNPYGAANSAGATLTVLPLTAPYPAVVMAGGPATYWRLNATNGGLALDYASGYDGTNNGTMALTTGLQSPAFAGFESTNKSFGFNGVGAYVKGPALDLNRSAFTVSAWITVSNFNLAGKVYEAIVTKGDSSWRLHRANNTSGINFGVNGLTPTFTCTENTPVDDGAWHYLVGVYNGSSIQLYLDGSLKIAGAQTGMAATNRFPIDIGENAEQTGRYWNGNISEVALYNRPLSSLEISNLYTTATVGPTMPVIVGQPASQGVLVGSSAAFSVSILGGGPWTYQWKKGGVNIPGATSISYSIPSAYYTDADSYSVGVTNTVGGVLSDAASLTVSPQPTFANLTNSMVVHLKFDYNYNDASGRGNSGTAMNSPAFVAGKIGSGAVHYLTDSANNIRNYVSLNSPADLIFGPGQDFSVAFWTRFTGLPGSLPFLNNTYNSYGDPGVTLAPSSLQGGWSWSLNDAYASAGQGIGVYGAIATLNDGQWHNLVYTFYRSGVATVYLDGAVANQTSIAAGEGWNLDTGAVWNIGQTAGGDYPVDGQFDMDDLGIWRQALSQANAQSIYIVGQNYGKSFDTYGPVTITANLTSSGLELIWQAGTLYSADTLTGQWTPVAGASAPYFKAPLTAANKFYRVKL